MPSDPMHLTIKASWDASLQMASPGFEIFKPPWGIWLGPAKKWKIIGDTAHYHLKMAEVLAQCHRVVKLSKRGGCHPRHYHHHPTTLASPSPYIRSANVTFSTKDGAALLLLIELISSLPPSGCGEINCKSCQRRLSRQHAEESALQTSWELPSRPALLSFLHVMSMGQASARFVGMLPQAPPPPTSPPSGLDSQAIYYT